MPIHYAGIACDLDGVMRLADHHGVELVEDAAQGVNSFKDGRALGSFGRFGCISFHETKNLHAGLCGALYINQAQDVERATFVWERGTNRQQQLKGIVDKYTWLDLGSSFYPTEFQAAFLLAQLEHLDDNHAARWALFEAYREGLKPLEDEGVLDLLKVGSGLELNAHAVPVLFKSKDQSDAVREHLKANQIAAYIGYVPLHSSPMGQRLGYRAEDLPVTEEMAGRVLRMPLHNDMSVEDVHMVCGLVRGLFE